MELLEAVIYHGDKNRLRPEMQREVAHQKNLLELSLGGHSPLNEPLSQSQSSVCGFLRDVGPNAI